MTIEDSDAPQLHDTRKVRRGMVTLKSLLLTDVSNKVKGIEKVAIMDVLIFCSRSIKENGNREARNMQPTDSTVV